MISVASAAGTSDSALAMYDGKCGTGYGYVAWVEVGRSEEAFASDAGPACELSFPTESRGRLGEVDWKKLSRVRFLDIMVRLHLLHDCRDHIAESLEL